jgi:glycosyltransferase involved in cell wall biosynthesis
MISTQVRPYKGFDLLLQFLNHLVCCETEFRYQFIFTAALSEKIRNMYPLLYERIHEITRVSNKQHALLYYISDLVLHPSYVEGGLGVYPQFEAATMGTPTLANIGRHIFEQSPDATHVPCHYAIDFTKTNALVARIHDLMVSEEMRANNLLETQRLTVHWEDSAKKYSEAFREVICHD